MPTVHVLINVARVFSMRSNQKPLEIVTNIIKIRLDVALRNLLYSLILFCDTRNGETGLDSSSRKWRKITPDLTPHFSSTGFGDASLMLPNDKVHEVNEAPPWKVGNAFWIPFGTE